MDYTSVFNTYFTIAPEPTNASSNTNTFISLLQRSYRILYITNANINVNRDKKK
jgi:hypothetical protein